MYLCYVKLACTYRCPRNDNKEFNRRKNPYEPRDHMVVLYKPDFYNTTLENSLENCRLKNSINFCTLIAIALNEKKIYLKALQ